MKNHISSLFRLLAVFFAFGSACMAVPDSHGYSSMPTDTIDVTSSSNSVTFCLGRFLVDVPAGSRLSGGNYKYDFIGIEPVKTVALGEYQSEVAGIESRLRGEKHRTEQKMLLQSVRPDKESMILASWKAEFSTALVNIAGYRWINGRRFLLQNEVSGDRQEFGMNRMREALMRIRTRAEMEIPTEPGYCFAGGFIANPRWRNEEANVDIDIGGHPDAYVSVWIYPLASHKHDKPLLERMGGMAQALGNLAASVHVLRKGDRQVGPYKGQEHLASAPSSGGMRGHAFVWETQGEGTLDTPAIKIELTTGYQDSKGNPQKTSLGDREAMALWDAVLGSFRLRPTGDTATTAGMVPAVPPRLPLGELAATGQACPQAGWWQTSEAGDVEGGARRYFKAGEAMPHAVALGAASLWQRLGGTRPSHRVATVWKLVAYDDGRA